MTGTTSTMVLPDHWTKDDHLGLEIFRGILRETLIGGPTRITVGVFGDWGSGKTSLMRMLMDDVASEGHRAVWFDAWKYDKESLSRALIQRVIDVLRDGADTGTTDKLDDLELHLYQDTRHNQEGELTFDWRQALKGTLKVGISMLPVVGGGLAEIVKQFDAKGTGGVDDLVKSLKRDQVQLHRERYHHLDEFQDTFTRILTPLTNAGKRLVIFIDDLDRCLPDDAIRVLEAIKLYLDSEGCVFVVGVDCQIIEKGIRMRYRDYVVAGEPCPISGADYLEKLVQVPFHLPPIDPKKLESYIAYLYPDCPNGVPAVCVAGLEPNPRKVKRAINVFRILWSVARLRDDLRDMIDPELMMKLVLIQLRWSGDDLFARIKREPYTLVVLEERIVLYEASMDAGTATQDGTMSHKMGDGSGSGSGSGFGDGSGYGGPESEARSEPRSDWYTRYANDEALRALLNDDGGKRFKDMSLAQLRKYVFLASTTAVQAADASLDRWQRLISDDEAMMRGACAEILETSEPDLAKYRGRLMEAMRMVDMPAKNRCLAGTALAYLGDPRFHSADGWYLPIDPPFGFIHVPAGEFTMGEDDNLHKVSLPTYYIGKYPVTVAQFRAFLDATGFTVRDPVCLKSPANHPVVRVDWQEALAYCAWLTRVLRDHQVRSGALFTDLNDREWTVVLPSEAEWEKAARGTDARMYPWGLNWDVNRANCDEAGIGSTSAVGCFPGGVSIYGVEEMSGNAWDWTRSKYLDYPYEADERESNEGDETRVLRGGSWFDVAPGAFSTASRNGFDPKNRSASLGFRCVVRSSVP